MSDGCPAILPGELMMEVGLACAAGMISGWWTGKGVDFLGRRLLKSMLLVDRQVNGLDEVNEQGDVIITA